MNTSGGFICMFSIINEFKVRDFSAWLGNMAWKKKIFFGVCSMIGESEYVRDFF